MSEPQKKLPIDLSEAEKTAQLKTVKKSPRTESSMNYVFELSYLVLLVRILDLINLVNKSMLRNAVFYRAERA